MDAGSEQRDEISLCDEDPPTRPTVYLDLYKSLACTGHNLSQIVDDFNYTIQLVSHTKISPGVDMKYQKFLQDCLKKVLDSIVQNAQLVSRFALSLKSNQLLKNLSAPVQDCNIEEKLDPKESIIAENLLLHNKLDEASKKLEVILESLGRVHSQGEMLLKSNLLIDKF